MRFLAIIQDTFREGIARKTIITFFIISTIFLLIGIAIAIFGNLPEITIPGDVPPKAKEEAGRMIVANLQAILAALANTAVIFLSIFATGSIIPNTMEKGTIDLLLSKPVSRTELLLGKMTGSVLIVLFNVAYFLVGMWLITSLKSGYWNPGFLLSIITITYSFFILYTFMMVIGVASRSTALSLILVYVYVFVVDKIIHAREQIAQALGNDTVGTVLDVFYYILPKPTAVENITGQIILGKSFEWEPIWSSAIFAAVMIVFSLYLFKKKEF
jgi:ABC-2 type transport system permease protein